MSLECQIGMRQLSCKSEELARSSCNLEMDRCSCSSGSTVQSTCGSDVVMIDDAGLQTITPVAKNLNVVNSKRVVVGPQSLTVTQNVNVVKESDWFKTREEWLALKYNKTENTSDNLRLVVIAHTAGATCNTSISCTKVVKNLQKYFISSMGRDIPYNFLIGGDGRVYEGRGWNIVGAHTLRYNHCSMGLAFTGDYREGLPHYSNVTDLQEQRAHMLFEMGVKKGHLHPQFHVLGALDLRPTESPGTKLYNAIRKWPNYDHKNLYKGKNCEQIQEMFKN
ncbi:unnamed protein product [Arctia plantaginis]|uniref:Peptidoglycan recognition protein n=1 Tax=Arctia plantaginis TaxID=874455 RepID=A0A8S0Z0R6_ARCPL|nr:unnamed protein product [Arctia plantaginis]